MIRLSRAINEIGQKVVVACAIAFVLWAGASIVSLREKSSHCEADTDAILGRIGDIQAAIAELRALVWAQEHARGETP